MVCVVWCVHIVRGGVWCVGVGVSLVVLALVLVRNVFVWCLWCVCVCVCVVCVVRVLCGVCVWRGLARGKPPCVG